MSNNKNVNIGHQWSAIARRVAAVTALGGMALMGFVAPAAAHVHVESGEQLAKGGYGVVRLIVPTESDEASTVGLTITVPEGVDLTSARTLPIPGWTATVEREQSGDGERVSRIRWQAADPANGLKASEFGVFTLSAGPWPEDTDSVPLPSEQIYSDGSVVSWNEVAVNAGIEPEHPAPVVALAEGVGHGDGHGGTTDSASADETHADGTDHATENDSTGWLWRTIAVVALALSLGATVAVIALVRRGHATQS
ncbi:YcnI family protein [Rhodococcus jostii]|uniref:YcnI family protein n=1 Tax=Rhodococcus jostii TaxID=132919 RepID=A0ABU4CU42_RHOJO|nr:YcnI family protein [Rhodococcus jostii]MDV6286817.1 YcnI family protein [Rhodococcus jostii]